MSKSRGRVYLVGAGPGDPGLLTLRGKECISRADVVVYDHLANRSFLQYARREAEFIYVGKRGGHHTVEQDRINSMMVERALEGLLVARLKGGDPFIFGRGGEEALKLAEAGVDFEIVPGVTSAIAVPAYAGIPLTHRRYTSTVAFVTGHEDPGKGDSSIAWDRLSTGAGTLVFLMGVGNLEKIAATLIRNGRAPETQAAVIHRGTMPEQRTVKGELRGIAALAAEAGITPPAVLVVGDVVELAGTMNWFESRPLHGRRIVVTRAREQASEFMEALSGLGASCIEFPTIEVVPPESWEPIDRALRSLEDYQWVIFTSVNGVRYFLERLEANQKDVRDLKGVKIGAIGPKTAQMWKNLGIQPDVMPGEYRAEAVAAALKDQGIGGNRVLLPRASKAREVLPEELRKMGAKVDLVPAYATVKPRTRKDEVRAWLEQGGIDMVTFTSSSTVRNFVEMFEEEAASLHEWMQRVPVACIGPVTAQTARENGLRVDLFPSEYTVDALTEGILEYFEELPD